MLIFAFLELKDTSSKKKPKKSKPKDKKKEKRQNKKIKNGLSAISQKR